ELRRLKVILDRLVCPCCSTHCSVSSLSKLKEHPELGALCFSLSFSSKCFTCRDSHCHLFNIIEVVGPIVATSVLIVIGTTIVCHPIVACFILIVVVATRIAKTICLPITTFGFRQSLVVTLGFHD